MQFIEMTMGRVQEIVRQWRLPSGLTLFVLATLATLAAAISFIYIRVETLHLQLRELKLHQELTDRRLDQAFTRIDRLDAQIHDLAARVSTLEWSKAAVPASVVAGIALAFCIVVLLFRNVKGFDYLKCLDYRALLRAGIAPFTKALLPQSGGWIVAEGAAATAVYVAVATLILSSVPPEWIGVASNICIALGVFVMLRLGFLSSLAKNQGRRSTAV